MSENNKKADWYQEGGPLPVAHPVRGHTAQLHFPSVDKLVWEVTDHTEGKTYKEMFVFEMQEVDEELVSNNE